MSRTTPILKKQVTEDIESVDSRNHSLCDAESSDRLSLVGFFDAEPELTYSCEGETPARSRNSSLHVLSASPSLAESETDWIRPLGISLEHFKAQTEPDGTVRKQGSAPGIASDQHPAGQVASSGESAAEAKNKSLSRELTSSTSPNEFSPELQDDLALEKNAIIETESRRYLSRLISRLASNEAPDAGTQAANYAPDAGTQVESRRYLSRLIYRLAANDAPDAGPQAANYAPDAGTQAAIYAPDAGTQAASYAPDAGIQAESRRYLSRLSLRLAEAGAPAGTQAASYAPDAGIQAESRRYLSRLSLRLAEAGAPNTGAESKRAIPAAELISVDAEEEAVCRRHILTALYREAEARVETRRHILTALYIVAEARVETDSESKRAAPALEFNAVDAEAKKAEASPQDSTVQASTGTSPKGVTTIEAPLVVTHQSSEPELDATTEGIENSADAAAGSNAAAARYTIPLRSESDAELQEALVDVMAASQNSLEDVPRFEIRDAGPNHESSASGQDLCSGQLSELCVNPQDGVEIVEAPDTSRDGVAMATSETEVVEQQVPIPYSTGHSAEDVRDEQDSQDGQLSPWFAQDSSRETAFMATSETKEVEQLDPVAWGSGHSAPDVRLAVDDRSEKLAVVPALPSEVETEMQNFIMRQKEAPGEEWPSAEALWPVEARTSMNPLGLPAPHRPTLTYFLTPQEERLAVAASMPQMAEIKPEPTKPGGSPRRHGRPLMKAYQYCSLQEARVALDVDKQRQVGGSSGSSTKANASGGEKSEVMSPKEMEQTITDASSPGRHLPYKPPGSAPSRRRPLRRNLHTKHGNDASREFVDSTSWSPLRGIESTCLLASLGPLQNLAQESDEKKGIALLEATLDRATPEGKTPRDMRPPSSQQDCRRRRRLSFPIKSGGGSQLTAAEISSGFANSLRQSDVKLDQGNSTFADVGAWQLKLTLETIRSMLGTDGAKSRPVSRGWSPDWTVQNSAPFRFRLPVDVLQTRNNTCDEAKPGEAHQEGEAGEVGETQDEESPPPEATKQEVSPQSLPPESKCQSQEPPNTEPTKQEVSPQKSPRRRKAWLPRLIPVRAPACSVLPKRDVVAAEEEETTALEESNQVEVAAS